MAKLTSLLFLSLAAGSLHAGIMPGSTNLGAIWFVGDSITQGNASNDTNNSVRGRVYTGLTSAGYSFTYTGSSTNVGNGTDGLPQLSGATAPNYASHDGWSGSMISLSDAGPGVNVSGRRDMTATLSSAWTTGRLATTKPSLILIMLGTNDIDRGGNPTTCANSMTTFLNWADPV